MDDRTYVRLHDGMPDHPKVVGLSDGAFRLYVESLCWCGRHLTDGAVPAAAMRRMGGWSPEAVGELTSARLIYPDDASQVRSDMRSDMRSQGESQNGSQSHPLTWLIHDYTEHQRTAEEVAAIRRAKHGAGVTGNHERWHKARGLRDPDCELCMAPDDASQVRSDMRSHDASGSDGISDRKHSRKTSPETETDKEKKKELDRIGTDDDEQFAAFWTAYPRKVGKGEARKAYRSAVIGGHVDPKVIILAAERFRDEAARERTERKFIPHPATWLRGERYNDEAHGSPAPGDVPTLPGRPSSPWDS